MKLRSILMVALLAVVCAMQAVPAKRGAAKIQQPDGSYVTICLHGDEWRHYQTTDDGYSVVKDSRGYYVYAQLQDGQLAATEQVAHDAARRNAQEQAFLAGTEKHLMPEMTASNARMKKAMQARQAEALAAPNKAVNYSNFKGLIILVEFNDQKFSRDDYPAIIHDMVNKEGYTGYDNEQLTGSVRDYFEDNSNGKFKPQFDIVGPYTINYSQYDAKGTDNANALMTAAVTAADADVNYKDYDRDNNGYVDLVYVIFAGKGSHLSGNDSRLFWPHRAAIYNPNYTNYYNYYIRKDGVIIFDYAASVELTTSWKTYSPRQQLDGIGTICHEFSHVLGLPDFYDTDYAVNGQSDHPGDWSLMAGGNYLNDGRTPCGYSLYERYAIGFMDEPQKIEATGSYTLNPLGTTFEGYRIDSPFSKEFYLLENRQKDAFKWDAYLPGSGMLVHRVDKSNNTVWDIENSNGNTVNANASRNYYELIRAYGGQGSGNSTAYDPFPGAANVTKLDYSTSPATLKTLSGSGRGTRWALSNIKQANGTITFDITDTWMINSLSFPEEITVGVGMSTQLVPVIEPANAQYIPSWAVTYNQDVAHVDKNTGVVTGLKPGASQVMLIATGYGDMENPVTATCNVNVVDIPMYNVAEFKEQEIGTESMLKLENAEVLFAKGSDVYVRDATGAIMMKNLGFKLSKNDRLNGIVWVARGEEYDMPQVLGTDDTNSQNLNITAGSEVLPREVSNLADLTEADYCDYITVKAAHAVNENNEFWLVSGDKRVRVWMGKYKISGVTFPSDFNNKYYDITGLYGKSYYKSKFFESIDLMKTPVEVEEPSGISEIRMDVKHDGRFYNLQGQRVGDNYKGIVIVNGKKVKK